MLDMSMNEKDKEYFITNIEVNDNKIIVTRADGSKTEEEFSGHNLGFYRNRMIENAKSFINPYLDDLGKDSFLTFVKRYVAIIGGVIGLYFLYNVDIHIVMKIILSILVVLGEVGYYLYNQLYLWILGGEVNECLATEYYLNNIDTFKYFDRDNYTDGFVIPPEDIGKYELTQSMLEKLGAGIKEYREKEVKPEDMKLVYQKVNENKKSML